MVEKASVNEAKGRPVIPYAAGQNERVKTAFANNIRRRMQELNLSQAELGRRSFLSRDDINRFVNGKTYPRPDKMTMLARGLRCKVDDIVPRAMMETTLPEEPVTKYTFVGQGRVWLQVSTGVSKAVADRIMQMIEDDNTPPAAGAAAE